MAKAMTHLVLSKTMILRGGDAIVFQAIESLFAEVKTTEFSFVERANFSWGYIVVKRRHHLSTESSQFVMTIKSYDKNIRKDFPVDRWLVEKAIEHDVAVIAYVLQFERDALTWIGVHFAPYVKSAVERAEIAFATDATTPVKKGPDRL